MKPKYEILFTRVRCEVRKINRVLREANKSRVRRKR